MAKAKVQKTEREEDIAQLRKWMKPGATIYTILRHVSTSGMRREIGVVIFRKGSVLHPNYSIGKVLGLRQGKRDGLLIGGCGMDMGFHLVYSLSRVLWPEGFERDGKHVADGGYALNQKWL